MDLEQSNAHHEAVQTKNRELASTITKAFLGSLFLAFLARVEIPLKPIPMTLQTLAVFLLALFQGRRTAALSCLFYLCEGTLGLSVFSAAPCSPLWILKPSAGFLISFPLAAYIIGTIEKKNHSNSALYSLFSIFVGQLVIYTIGISWLQFFIGMTAAIQFGVLPFIPTTIVKVFVAISIRKSYLCWKQ